MAAAGGVFYYRRKIKTELPSQTWSVPPGDKITLNPDTEIQTGDEIQWLFGAEDTLIAEIKKETGEMKTYDGPDRIFKNRLKLDETTGSLTIKFINTLYTGLYTLKIRRGRETLNKKFQVSVNDWMRSVMEGESVTLYSDIKMQTNDEIQWLFDDEEQQTVIAEIKTRETKYDGPDWRFRDRLELDKETGSLTITTFTAAHTGFYTLKIRRDRKTIYKRFYIFVESESLQSM
ncbi:uncharacterized protein LOC127154103 isoform X2 [Labeo rohita]|uniref:uncharacterized protein LOC127154103 isoform X2 n=1 Tax=Labeo rohita TaxID=84645 RepID=UPI0021E2A8B3|nr:uncharacterized protein LOC127154103 isoform X2 [Labeo rohita]